MREGYLSDSTSDIGIDKRQRHATLAFLTIDMQHGDPPSRPPITGTQKTGGLDGEQGRGSPDFTWNDDVALSNLRNSHITLSILRNEHNYPMSIFLKFMSHATKPCKRSMLPCRF